MLIYPQLTSGALTQFPVQKTAFQRTVVNTMADGSSIRVADPSGASVEWQLSYAEISDTELSNLQSFFASAAGSLEPFTFLDPSGNLLAWSEDLLNAAWALDPFLTPSPNVADPLGGGNAWQLVNAGAGSQGITQTLNAPAGYTYTFSLYASAAAATTIQIQLAGLTLAAPLAAGWTRFSLTGSGVSGAESVVFGIEVPAGATVNVFGPQAEAQAAASVYQTSTTGGVYAHARFRDDVFTFTSTDVGRSSVTVNITYEQQYL